MRDDNCLFCKIVGGDIPSNKLYEDELCYAFYDIAPQAPTHFLVIPKEHIGSVAEVNGGNSAVVAHIFEVPATQIAVDLGNRMCANMVTLGFLCECTGMLTRDQLLEAGLPDEGIFGLDLCTASMPDSFFSYRRNGICGRQANVIWIA